MRCADFGDKQWRMGWIFDEKVADSFQDDVVEISSFSRFKATTAPIK